MLPDFRVVIVAVISTFLFTVGVGFYTSSRLLNEPRKARSDSLAALEDSPINRIALNWPEPVPQNQQLDLDFAVTLNGSRGNPVRDVTNEALETQAELKSPAPRTTTVDSTPQNPTPPASETTAKTDEPAAKTAVASAPAEEPASVQAVRDILSTPAPELAFPTSGLPVVAQGAEAIVAPAPLPAEGPATTALMVPDPKADIPAAAPESEKIPRTEKPDNAIEARLPDQSDPDATGTITVQEDDVPMPQARPDGILSTSKKSIIITKRAKKPVRMTQKRRLRMTPAKPPETPFIFPFNFFTIQPNQTNQTNQTTQASPATQTR